MVKVCGLTREADALLCAALGADLLGFIFHPGSPRNTTPEFPARLDLPRTGLPGLRKVGVFVDQSPDEVLRTMAAGRLNLAQLHGGQDEAFCAALAARLGPERVIKVFWPEKAASAEAFQAELERFAPHCGLMLADAGSGGGGHGRPIGSEGEDKGGEVLAQARFPRPWLLAGGLGPDNAVAMLSRFRSVGNEPLGLDLNSGVESAPGVKDETKLRAAFKAVHMAARTAGRAAQTHEVIP
ncbi:MAG: N-(5'-phosphoribosyl)anthranilate isomerase [Desulfovibrio sp.]|nr:N-(5'-phosphoribosyl)anthranilate isomerase [Desulfovibrio sp.]